MIDDHAIAEHALLAYDKPTIIVGNAKARVDRIDGLSLVSIAGTDDGKDWLNNITMFPWKPYELKEWVHAGFWRYFNKVRNPILSELYLNGLPAVFTGHSLGGISACYGAAMWRRRGNPVVNLTTFGAPRGCSNGVIDIIKHIPGKRYVRNGDQVTWAGMFGYDRREATLLPGNDGPIDHPMQGYFDQLLIFESE